MYHQKITNRVPKTKTLPCGAIFQKWHPIIQPWGISKLPLDSGTRSTILAKKPFAHCSLVKTQGTTTSLHFRIKIHVIMNLYLLEEFNTKCGS